VGYPFAQARPDHHGDVAARRDPAVGQDPAQVGDRAPAYVDVQWRLNAAG
jgi:hypothetical protein